MRYDAFISYRHSELDMYVAKKIHKYLENFKVPKAVAKKYGKKKIHRVFRDQEELPIGSDLGNNIEGALAESEFLIVICSPRTPASEWVQKEIQTFIAMHGRQNVLAVLIEGEPYESFPRQLLCDEFGRPVEPLAADVRGANKKEVNSKIKVEAMRLCAPLLYCNYDDLRQRHRERRMRKILAISVSATTVIGALGISFGLYSSYKSAIIQQNYLGKLENESKYLAQEAIDLSEDGYNREAALIAVEAIRGGDEERPFVATSQYALTQALHTYDNGYYISKSKRLNHDFQLYEVKLSNDGKYAVTVDNCFQIHLWDIEKCKEILTIDAQRDSFSDNYSRVSIATVVADDILFIGDSNGYRAVDFKGQIIYEYDVEHFLGAEISLDYSRMAYHSEDTVYIVDTQTGEEIASFSRNREDSSSVGESAFSSDNRYYGIGAGKKLTIYDLEKKKAVVADMKANYACGLSFSNDGKCIVIDKKANYSAGNVTIYVQAFDCSNGKKKWTKELKYNSYFDENLIIKSTDYAVVTCGGEVSVYDTESGDIVSSFGVGSVIRGMFLGSYNYGIFYTRTGLIRVIDLLTGDFQEVYDVNTDVEAGFLAIKSGVYAVGSIYTQDLLILKNNKGSAVKEVESADLTINGIYFGENSTGYAVQSLKSTTGDGGSIIVYDKSDTIIRTLSNLDSIADIYYYDDDTIIIQYSDFSFGLYDISDGVLSDIDMGVDYKEASSNICLSTVKNSKIILLYHSMDKATNFIIYDMGSRKVVESDKIKDTWINGACITNTSNSMYFYKDDGSVSFCNIDDMSVKDLKLSFEVDTSVASSGRVLTISADDRYLALICKDGYLRVLDTESLEVKAELKEAFWISATVEFSPDGNKLYYCGDAGVAHIYDIEEGKELYSQKMINKECGNVYWAEEDGYITIGGYSKTYIIDSNQYVNTAIIDDLAIFFPKEKKIIMAHTGQLFMAKYQSVDMLIEDALEKYGDIPLSAEERHKYNID